MNKPLLFLLTLNTFIAATYLLQQLINCLIIRKRLSQQQNLLCSRTIFLLSIITFIIFKFDPYHLIDICSNTHFPQFIHKFSLPNAIHFNNILPTNKPSAISLYAEHHNWQHFVFTLIIAIGILSYLIQIHKLYKLIQSASYKKQYRNLQLIYTTTTQQPLCFNFLKRSYIIVPLSLLDNYEEFKTAIKHELQHCRQHDTQFRHILAIVNILCWWNPLYRAYSNWLISTQEFACDEALIIRKKITAKYYAQTLLAIAKKIGNSHYLINLNITAAIFSKRNRQLKRRIQMIATKTRKSHKSIVFTTILLLSTANTIIAFALSTNHTLKAITQQKLAKIIANIPNNKLEVQANKHVLKALNSIITNPKLRVEFKTGLRRMQAYKAEISNQLATNNLPQDLLAIPLLESRYKNLNPSKHPPYVGGIWQLNANTAKHYGLKINTKIETKIATTYLATQYTQFNSWPLAIISYNAGTKLTNQLIKTTQQTNPWQIISNKNTPLTVKQYLPLVNAAIIIIHNPKLVQ